MGNVTYKHASGNPMQAQFKPEHDLIEELASLKQRIAELEQVKLNHKQTEEALRESEEVFRLLFERSGYAASLIEDGRFIDCNEAALKMLGCSNKSEFISLTPSDISPEKQPDGKLSSEKATRMLETAFNDGSNRFEWLHKKLDGTQACLDVMLTPITMKGRKLIYTIWRDITAQKKAEEALKKSEERFRMLVDYAPLGISLIKKNDGFEYINPIFTEIFGYTLEDIVNKQNWLENVYPYLDDHTQIKALSERDFSKGTFKNRIWEQTIKVHCKDKKEKIINTHTKILDDGRQLVFYEDITQQRGIEVQLRQANKIEAIGTLASGIAHDFNNILGGMLGYTEMSLLHIGDDNSLLKHHLEQTRIGIHRATDLVKQILTFGRQTSQEMRPVRVIPLLKETLRLIRAVIPSYIEITYNLEADRDLILADPTLIHQVLMNLCTNAAQAMHEKGGIMRVEIKNLYLNENNNISVDIKPGWHLLITVSDTGPGIDAAVIDRIFDPFFTTKKPGDGTGLGLAVVHGIVKNIGGIIAARSCPGEGAVFDIYLPIIEGKSNVKDDDLKKTYVGGKEQILFVDDEENITHIAREMLSKMGYEVLATTSSITALETFRLQPDRFDIVITDQTMPAITGTVMAAEMLKIRPDLPIIISTGFNGVTNNAQAEAIGIGGFIMKPFTMANLDATIRKVLSREA